MAYSLCRFRAAKGDDLSRIRLLSSYQPASGRPVEKKTVETETYERRVRQTEIVEIGGLRIVQNSLQNEPEVLEHHPSGSPATVPENWAAETPPRIKFSLVGCTSDDSSAAELDGDYIAERILQDNRLCIWELPFRPVLGFYKFTLECLVDHSQWAWTAQLQGVGGSRSWKCLSSQLQWKTLELEAVAPPPAVAPDPIRWPKQILLTALSAGGASASSPSSWGMSPRSTDPLTSLAAEMAFFAGGSGSGSSSGGRRPVTPPPPPPCEECPCPVPATSGGPVNYGSGQIVLSVTDLFSNAFGTSWKQTRTYSNQLASSSAEIGQGYNWLVVNWPLLEEQSDGTLTAVRGTNGSLWFAPVTGGYQGMYGAKSTLVHDSANHIFLLTQPDGIQQEYHDFDQTTYPAGSFSRQVEPGGLETSVQSYTNSGLIAEIHRSATVDGQPLTEAFVYTYTDNDQVESLTLRRQLGGGGWEDVKRVIYSYWDGTSTFGSLGDLQQVTIQTPTETGWADSQITVYRYYVEGQANGFTHGLKFVINPATYQRMVSESVDPLTASDGVVATYADYYYEFDSDRRVTLERTDGGAQTYTFAYTVGTVEGTPTDWAMKTVETRPDGNQNIVYTNGLGQYLINDLTDGTDHWIDAYSYDDDWRELWHAHPSAVLGYDDSSTTLNLSLRSAAGLIEVTNYYSTTGSGAAEGYVSSKSLKQGSAGTEIPQIAYQYTSQTANGTTIYPVSQETRYRDDAGTLPIVTTYSYTFYTGTVQQQEVITTLPEIPTSQNGDDTAATTRQYFNLYGQLTWSMDERGFIAKTSYDLATGGVLQQIQDVDTSTASGVPSGWTTPAGGGLNLVTDALLDDQGRTIQSLGPVHQIDLNGTATTIRQASWNVYDDDNHITYSGNGYATGSAAATTTRWSIRSRSPSGMTAKRYWPRSPLSPPTLTEHSLKSWRTMGAAWRHFHKVHGSAGRPSSTRSVVWSAPNGSISTSPLRFRRAVKHCGWISNWLQTAEIIRRD